MTFSDQPIAQPTEMEESKVTSQIVRGARFISREGANQVTLRLDPPELGEVTIRLSSINKTVTGEIRVGMPCALILEAWALCPKKPKF